MPCGAALLGGEGGSPGAQCGAALEGPRGSRARDGVQLGGHGTGPRVTTLAFLRGGVGRLAADRWSGG